MAIIVVTLPLALFQLSASPLQPPPFVSVMRPVVNEGPAQMEVDRNIFRNDAARAAPHAVAANNSGNAAKRSTQRVLPGSSFGKLLATEAATGSRVLNDNFDYRSSLQLVGGTGVIAKSGLPDAVGAFRFVCGAGQVSYDDPILYPGQPGRSHLHQYFGNLSANGNSTYASIRTSGSSSCGSINNSVSVNRSAYWMPAMLDGVGNVVRPDYVTMYYKRRPKSDPKCSLSSSDPKAQGNCVGIPPGIKFIFGWDPTGRNSARTGSAYYNCQGPSAIAGHYPDLTDVAKWCPNKVSTTGERNQLGAVISAPTCWDGRNLDSPDHRSHVTYADYGTWGYLRCPATHPFVIPTFTMQAWYTVDSNIGRWTLSSDAMAPGTPKGYTFHADYFEGWSPKVKAFWEANCIDKLLNCSGGDLGNGQRIIGADKPTYGWANPARLVKIPANNAGSIAMMSGASPLKPMPGNMMEGHGH